jgi:dihydrofolate reductase
LTRVGTVVASQSVSLDGFSAGANAGRGNPLGDDGDRLHHWLYDLDPWRERHKLEGGASNVDADTIEEMFANLGAVIMGRVMFESGDEPWGDEPPFHVPVFVLTHERLDPVAKHGGTSFTFVSDGIERALDLAQAAAGDREVSIAGGADTIQQFLAAGLVDELQLELVPIVLGKGRRFFDNLPENLHLEPIRVVHSPAVSHIRYRVDT